jgi:hypothetical protein
MIPRRHSLVAVEIAPDVLSRCLAIIVTAAQERQSCCEQIAGWLKLATWARANPKVSRGGDAKARREVAEDLRVLRSAATLMQQKPYLALLNWGVEEEWARAAWKRAGEYLASVVSAVDRFDEIEPHVMTTRPPEPCKFYCAMGAFDLLEKFSCHPPTLSADGPFYRLASVLYEGASGEGDVSLERPCRTAFRRLAGRRTDGSLAAHMKMRQ